MNPLALREAAIVIGGANAVGFAVSAGFQTHIFTDLVGVGSFVLTTLRLTSLQNKQQLLKIPTFDNRLLLVNALVGLWGSRLVSYLFHRILYIKEDKRLHVFYPAPGEGYLDAKRSNFPLKLLSFWSIQAMWGFITMLPVTLLNGAILKNPANLELLSFSKSSEKLFSFVGGLLKLPSEGVATSALKLGCKAAVILPVVTLAGGIAIEAIADYQKYKYKSDPKTKDHWCDVGLWKYSRYPNYFGEMTVWWSIFGATLPALIPQGLLATSLGVLSPLFVTGLLMKLSGVPIHDRNNNKRFGQDPDYQKYLKTTPTIIPRLFPADHNDDKSN